MLNLELRTLIQAIVRDEFEEIYGVPCKVLSVYEDEGFVCDCQPLSGKATIKGVKLQAENKDGILITPSIDSVVFVVMEDEFNGFISMYGCVDQIQFYSGSNGGLVKVSELVDKLNVLEQRMTDHQHLVPQLGQSQSDPATNPIITETTVEDLENPLIKH